MAYRVICNLGKKLETVDETRPHALKVSVATEILYRNGRPRTAITTNKPSTQLFYLVKKGTNKGAGGSIPLRERRGYFSRSHIVFTASPAGVAAKFNDLLSLVARKGY